MIVTINGKQAGTDFNMYAMEQLDSLSGNGNAHYFTQIIHAGYKGWVYIHQKDFGFVDPKVTISDILSFVSDATYDEDKRQVIIDVQNEFLTSKEYEKLIKKGTEILEKKSLNEQSNGTTSTPTPGE